MAQAGARHFFMVRYWPRVKAWLSRALNCSRCLRSDKAPVGIERRGK